MAERKICPSCKCVIVNKCPLTITQGKGYCNCKTKKATTEDDGTFIFVSKEEVEKQMEQEPKGPWGEYVKSLKRSLPLLTKKPNPCDCCLLVGQIGETTTHRIECPNGRL
jgi:hypothetical protein